MDINGQFYTPPVLPLRKSQRYPFNRKLVGSQKWLEASGEKNLLLLPGIEPRFLGRPAYSLVTTATITWLLLCSETNVSTVLRYVLQNITYWTLDVDVKCMNFLVKNIGLREKLHLTVHTCCYKWF